MNTKIITIILVFILLDGCSEFLVVEPDNQVSIVEQFSTKEGIQQTVSGMYYDFEDLYTGKAFIYADLLGGNITFAPNKNDYIVEIPPIRNIEQIYEFRDLPDNSDMETFYDACYELINATNLIIERVDNAGVLSTEESNQVKAEALACRTYTHYLLTLLYTQNYNYTPDASHKGIVYNTSTIVAGVDFPSRLTLAETYALMKSDLETAISLFTDKQAMDHGPANTYFNALTTAAVAARIALQMNDWETAWHYADTVIEYAGLKLMADSTYIDQWKDPVNPLSETVFELSNPKNTDGTPSSSIAHSFYNFADEENYNEYVASGDLLELYTADDIRKDMFVEKLLPTSENGIIQSKVYYFTRKFQVEKGDPAVRLSEMYLIRAEAAARMTPADNTAARIDLNRIRYRAGLDPLVTDEGLLEQIFLERRRELAFENFLLFDIARYQKDIVRNKGCISTVCNLSYPSDYYILPIPESTKLLNENMEQNDGY